MSELKCADVVEAENVVGMRMRKHHRVHLLHAEIQHLLTEVRRRVDDEAALDVRTYRQVRRRVLRGSFDEQTGQ